MKILLPMTGVDWTTLDFGWTNISDVIAVSKVNPDGEFTDVEFHSGYPKVEVHANTALHYQSVVFDRFKFERGHPDAFDREEIVGFCVDRHLARFATACEIKGITANVTPKILTKMIYGLLERVTQCVPPAGMGSLYMDIKIVPTGPKIKIGGPYLSEAAANVDGFTNDGMAGYALVASAMPVPIGYFGGDNAQPTRLYLRWQERGGAFPHVKDAGNYEEGHLFLKELNATLPSDQRYMSNVYPIFQLPPEGGFFTSTSSLNGRTYVYLGECDATAVALLRDDGVVVSADPKGNRVLDSITCAWTSERVTTYDGYRFQFGKIPLGGVLDNRGTYVEAFGMGTANGVRGIGEISNDRHQVIFNDGVTGQLTRRLALDLAMTRDGRITAPEYQTLLSQL